MVKILAETFKSICPLNCYDSCSWVVTVEDGKITKVSGDKDSLQTKGFLCSKAQKQVERLYSVDRIKHPLKKVGSYWQRVSWDEAFDLITTKLKTYIENDGLDSIVHIYDSGSNGILRDLDRRFFNCLGGVAGISGSLCWGSGIAAQYYDFGGLEAHRWDDVENSKTIILWGRDPAVTNLHLVPYLLNAKKKGAKIIVINPIEVESVKFAHQFISIRPGTDGALALAMAHVILKNGWADLDFISNYVYGFQEFARLVKDFTPEKASKFTDIPTDVIERLARDYAISKPSTILVGYGIQRYINGGQTVRALDALGAITGNIGISGGGVNYAGSNKQALLKDISGQEYARKTRRQFPFPVLGKALLTAQEPPVKTIFVTRSNPITQAPNTEEMLLAFNKAEFKVCIDLVLTDTADRCDLFLPCTTVFEEENLVASTWNYYLGYAPKLIEPLGESRSETEIFTELAIRMGIEERFKVQSSRQWLEEILVVAKEYGITMEKLQEGAQINPLSPVVAWENKNFKTPSGKIELYSNGAKENGVNPLPEYVLPKENVIPLDIGHQEFPFQFLTVHPKDGLNAQFRQEIGQEDAQIVPYVYLHPQVAEKYYVRNNDFVIVENERGQIKGMVKITSKVRPDVVKMYQGSWIKEGGGVNFLTPSIIPDMGEGTPYYDCVCNIRKVMID